MLVKHMKTDPPLHVSLNISVTRPSFKNLGDKFLTKWQKGLFFGFWKDGLLAELQVRMSRKKKKKTGQRHLIFVGTFAPFLDFNLMTSHIFQFTKVEGKRCHSEIYWGTWGTHSYIWYMLRCAHMQMHIICRHGHTVNPNKSCNFTSFLYLQIPIKILSPQTNSPKYYLFTSCDNICPSPRFSSSPTLNDFFPETMR